MKMKCRRVRRLNLFIMALAGFAQLGLAQSFYFEPGDEGTLTNSAAVFGPAPGYRYGLGATTAVSISGISNGLYFVESSYGVNATHATNVLRSLLDNGLQYNSTLTENHTNDNKTVACTDGRWSGFVRFDNSTANWIALNNGAELKATRMGDGVHTRGVWRVSRVNGELLDVVTLQPATNFPYTYDFSPNVPKSLKYKHSVQGSKTNHYDIGQYLAPGRYAIDISWSVNPRHGTAIQYLFSESGGIESATTALEGISQQHMSDGRTFTYDDKLGYQTWSGFKPLGVFNVTANSRIWLTTAQVNTYMSLGPVHVVRVDPPAPTTQYLSPLTEEATRYIQPASTAEGGPELKKSEWNYGFTGFDGVTSNSVTLGHETGRYWVEVSWGYHPTNSATNVVYSINGTNCLTVNQRLNADASNSKTNKWPNTWSGFKALSSGTNGFGLVKGETVLTATQNGGGILSRAMYRVTPLTGHLLDPVGFATTTYSMTSAPKGNYYRYVQTAEARAFNIGSVSTNAGIATGWYRLAVSWGAHPSHAPAVSYFYDRAGTGMATAQGLASNISQRVLSDGRAFGKPTSNQSGGGDWATWSAFKDLGVIRLTPESKLWLTNTTGSAYLSLGTLQLTPTEAPWKGTLIRVL